jgi:hypothetical protein
MVWKVGCKPISNSIKSRFDNFRSSPYTVGRHWFPVIACKRAIVILDIAKTPIEIREGCPLFPSVGNSADGRQGAVFHSYLDAACAIGSRWRGLDMGGREYRAGDQQHCKHAERYFHGRSLQELNLTFSTSLTLIRVSGDPLEPQLCQHCSQARMLPASSWLAPATGQCTTWVHRYPRKCFG